MLQYMLFLLTELSFVFQLTRSSSCVCDYSQSKRKISPHRRLIDKENNNFKFYNTKNVGEAYTRPNHVSSHYKSLLKSTNFVKFSATGSPDTNVCYSEQIHLTLGNDAESVIISYTSNVSTSIAVVEYSLIQSALMSTSASSSASVITVPGYSESYTECNYAVTNVYDPAMGEPYTTAQVIFFEK